MSRVSLLVSVSLLSAACSGGSHAVSPEPDGGDTDSDTGFDNDAGPDSGAGGWRMSWAVRAGSDHDEVLETSGDLKARDDGFVLVPGIFDEGADFGEGQPGEVIPAHYGFLDGFVAGYDVDGTLELLRTVGGMDQDTYQSLAFLPDGGFVATGGICALNDVYVDTGIEEPEHEVVTTPDDYGVVLVRYDEQGRLMWIRPALYSEYSVGVRVVLLETGVILVSGDFLGELTLGSSEEDSLSLDAGESYDAFVAAYSQDGDLMWAQDTAVSQGESGTAMGAILVGIPGGGFLISGEYAGDVVMGKGQSNETVLQGGIYDYRHYIARFSDGGELAWAFDVGGDEMGMGSAIAVMPDGDGFAVGGSFKGTLALGEGQANEEIFEAITDGRYDAFIARYTMDGELTWARRIGGGSPSTASNYANSVADATALADRGLVVCGIAAKGAVFGEGEPTETQIDATSAAYVAVYGSKGDFEWVQTMGRTDPENMCKGVDALGDSTIFATGKFSGEDVPFGTYQGDMTYLTSKGNEDIFVLRMDRVQSGP